MALLKTLQRKLTYVPISTITVAPRNPRRHTRAQVEAIAKSIAQFGFNAPLLVDQHNRLVAGHGRFEAAKLLGLKEIPIIRLEDLSETEARAYMIADNRLSDRSEWDEPVLALQLKELSEMSLDFDIEVTGFEAPEIDFWLQSLEKNDQIDAADAFEMPQGAPTSRTGDLWFLGDHRLYCGNALDSISYETLMAGDEAAAVFTDAPYNVRIAGNVSGLGRNRHREFAMASGEMSPEEFSEFLCTAFREMARRTKPGAVIYACMDWRHIGEMIALQKRVGFDLLNLCVWVKTNGGMGSFYRSRHELVFVFRNGSHQHQNNVQLGRFGRNRTNVWTYAGANCFGKMGGESVLDIHPTVKPIRLVADALLDATRKGELVLDPFCGSGTTVLAAERTSRRGRGIELDPHYVDATIRRWESLTGKSAEHQSGKTFSELHQERTASK